MVDGAVNELHKYNETLDKPLIPDLISGDFDSVQPDLLQHYKEKVLLLFTIFHTVLKIAYRTRIVLDVGEVIKLVNGLVFA